MTFKELKRKIKYNNKGNLLCEKYWDMVERREDMRICGVDLCKKLPSPYMDEANGIGMTGMHSAHYAVLDRIFAHIDITADDNLLDVGCGKGRVLAYLISRDYPCRINGVELNAESGGIARDWAERYGDRVNVIVGDAFEQSYDDYTILFMYRPFLPKTFEQFLDKMEGDMTHPITLVYLSDQSAVSMLGNRAGWTKVHRERLFRIHGVRIAQYPQGYSIWRYNPPTE